MDRPDELFFEKQRRIERENMEFCRLIGEKDTEIAGLREALCGIVIACDGGEQLWQIRGRALRAMGEQNGGRDVDRNAD